MQKESIENIFITLIISLIVVLTSFQISEIMRDKNDIAIIETSKGVIKFELYEDKTPISTSNFIELVQSGFYEGLTFHKVVPDTLIQGGDPTGTGNGGSNKTIPLEIHPDLRHTMGAVGMAHARDPDSASSQFYITLSPQPRMDSNYAVFGQVIEGQDVVSRIRIGDTMLSITIDEQ